MGIFYERALRPLLFSADPERTHHWATGSMALLGWASPLCRLLESCNQPRRARPVECFGLKFPNAVGLAAGFDKNAVCWPAAAALGFGHVEVGTVTRLKQPGSPRPRLFRYPREQALINRMGFNNDGAEAVAARLCRRPGPGARRIPVGINIGKSKVVALDDAVEDYLQSFNLLCDHADYFAINVSSPNTPDLRKLQEDQRLVVLLRTLEDANRERPARFGKPRRPLLLKIAPDLTYRQIDAILATVLDLGLDGIIATNTTLDRPGRLASANESGGLSGAPLRRKSTQIISYIAKATDGRLPIIGVGGITDAESAAEKLDAGACLVQVYTGLVFHGPLFARDVARALAIRYTDWV